MPACVDTSGLRNLGNRLRAWINSDLNNEIMETVITEVMPGIMGNIYMNAGIPIAIGGKEDRYAPIVAAGAGGVTAYQEISTTDQEDNVGTQKFGVFPIVRSGSRLQMMVSKDQQQGGQKTISESVDAALTDESIQSNVIYPLLAAIERAKERL